MERTGWKRRALIGLAVAGGLIGVGFGYMGWDGKERHPLGMQADAAAPSALWEPQGDQGPDRLGRTAAPQGASDNPDAGDAAGLPESPFFPGRSGPIPSEAPPAPDGAKDEASAEETELVPYDGPVEHIFFHPLIVYPERAFDGDRMAQGYDDWFVTVPEFKSVLTDLYRNHYVLVDIRSLFEETPGTPGTPDTSGVPGASGTESRQGTAIRLKKLFLPAGKKPLVLSVDDLNYYSYMKANGNAFKLVLDAEGRTAAFSVAPGGEERISRDDEIVPIVDAFVEEHPDFSFRGAKGVLALTGYEGILGYRTDVPDSPSYETEKEEALRVVGRLKDTGWSFASHSWGHPKAEQADVPRLERDTDRWKREVEPLVGPTPVYIYPYGARLKHGDPKFRLLTGAGFKLFCGVGPAPYLQADGSAAEMDRRHVDGVALRTQAERLAPLCAMWTASPSAPRRSGSRLCSTPKKPSINEGRSGRAGRYPARLPETRLRFQLPAHKVQRFLFILAFGLNRNDGPFPDGKQQHPEQAFHIDGPFENLQDNIRIKLRCIQGNPLQIVG